MNKKYHVLTNIIIILLLCFSAYFCWFNFLRLGFSVFGFASDVTYYFSSIFGLDLDPLFNFYDFLARISNVTTTSNSGISSSWDSTWFIIYSNFAVCFNSLYFSFTMLSASSILMLLVELLVLLIPIFLLTKYLIKRIMFEPRENDVIGSRSAGLIRYDKIKSSFKSRIVVKIVDYFDWLRLPNHNIYIGIFLFIIAYDTNLIAFAFDTVGFVFYFFSTFDFVFLYHFFYYGLLDLWPILSHIPWPVYIIVAYLIFDYIRSKNALNRNYGLLYLIEEFVKTLGAIFIVNGGPRTGKTKFITTLSLVQVEVFLHDLQDTMNKFSSYFPEFNWRALEVDIENLYSSKELQNTYQVEKHFENVEIKFNNLFDSRNFDDASELIYGYSLDNSFDHYNELKLYSLFDAIITYGKAYFLYMQSEPASISNYPIRHDGILVKNFNNHPFHDYSFFHRKSNYMDYSSFSIVNDFDLERLGKKVSKESEELMKLDCGVITLTEIPSERGNQITNRGIDPNSEEANVLNDGFNKFLRIFGHLSTIDFKYYLRGFMDGQRMGDVGLSLNDIAESKGFILSVDKDKTTLRFYWYSKMIVTWINNITTKFHNAWELVRSDRTLFSNFVEFWRSWSTKYLEHRKNLFGYDIFNIEMQKGSSEISNLDISTVEIALPYKLSNSDRYQTDVFRYKFEDLFIKQKESLFKSVRYSGLKMNESEFKLQHSFMFINNNGKAKNQSTDSSDSEDDLII